MDGETVLKLPSICLAVAWAANAAVGGCVLRVKVATAAGSNPDESGPPHGIHLIVTVTAACP